MKILRWILAAPGAVAAWYFTFFVGIFAYQAAEKAACPASALISGFCMSENVQRLLDGVIVAFIALSAIAVVSAAVAIAPAHKVVVAWVVFCAGAVVAGYFAIATRLYFGGCAATISGLAVAMGVTRHLRKKNHEDLWVVTDAA